VTASLGVLTKLEAPPGREGAAFGAASSAQGLGWGLGPMLGSILVAIAGIPVLYLICGLLMLGLMLPATRGHRRPAPAVIRHLASGA
jgi:MFS family permease